MQSIQSAKKGAVLALTYILMAAYVDFLDNYSVVLNLNNDLLNLLFPLVRK